MINWRDVLCRLCFCHNIILPIIPTSDLAIHRKVAWNCCLTDGVGILCSFHMSDKIRQRSDVLKFRPNSTCSRTFSFLYIFILIIFWLKEFLLWRPYYAEFSGGYENKEGTYGAAIISYRPIPCGFSDHKRAPSCCIC